MERREEELLVFVLLLTSWRVDQALQLQNKLLCWMRDSAMGMMSARSRLEQLAWLLEYDSAVLDDGSAGDTR